MRDYTPLSRNARLSIPSRQSHLESGERTRYIHLPERKLVVSKRGHVSAAPILVQTTVSAVDPFEILKQQIIEDSEQEHILLVKELDDFITALPKEEVKKPAKPKHQLALLIAAHNEELVIENTIKSAIRCGQPREHIYVVDDNSTDPTSKLARKLLPRKNVKKVSRSGKGLALMRGTEHFKLIDRYEWIHIADADGSFSDNYFDVLRNELDPSYAAVTGYIKSQPGGVISQCRVYEYTLGMEVMRRFQSLFGVINIIPGATSCFRSDVFAKVDFNSGSMVEDFDVTVQIHRNKLGEIRFMPEITALTQDPKDLKDYIKQVNRWNRGFMQVVKRHNLGMKLHKIDTYITYQLIVSFFYMVNFFFWIPFLVITSGNLAMPAVLFVADVLFTFAMVIMAAGSSKRWDIIGAFPNIYGMRWLNMILFMKAIFEVFILRQYKVSTGLWDTAGRRYKPTAG